MRSSWNPSNPSSLKIALSTILLTVGCDLEFEAQYVECDEFAGVGLVPLANVVDRVPDDYIVIEPIPGQAIVVAQAGSCSEIAIGPTSRPGIFAQFGVGIVPPLEPGTGDFFQLLYVTDFAPLATALRATGVDAHHSPKLEYKIDTSPALAISVPNPSAFAFEIAGPIGLPDPQGPPQPTSVFNYYAQSDSGLNVLQQNVVEGIRFGEGSAVTLTAIGPEIQAIVGADTLTFPFFSSPEVFDQADVLVTADAF